MRQLSVILVLLWLLAEPWALVALADGGAVRVLAEENGYRVAVFTSPTPLRAGPVDISVLVQNIETGQLVDDPHVAIRVVPRDRSVAVVEAVATFAEATNKLMQAALVELPIAGWWDVEIVCTTDAGSMQTGFAMEALPPLPRWLTVWPWFTWPLAVIGLFVAHRRLAENSRASEKSIGHPQRATV